MLQNNPVDPASTQSTVSQKHLPLFTKAPSVFEQLGYFEHLVASFNSVLQNKPVDSALSQILDTQAHAALFAALPSVFAQFGIGNLAHALLAALQNFPLDDKHEEVPQLQSAAFSALPSDLGQVGYVEHLSASSNSALQNKPVDPAPSHTMDAHAHDALFSAMPLVLAQFGIGTLAHALRPALQNFPLESVHVVVPHLHAAVFSAVPLDLLQSGTRIHILNPLWPALLPLSEYQSIKSPDVTETSLGPVVPQYCVPPTVTGS